MNTITINTDGGSRGNPGPAAIGVVIQCEGRTINHERYLGVGTNNHAEYTAVLDALDLLPDLIKECQQPVQSVQFFLDSLLVVKQIMGEYRVKEVNLMALCAKARQKVKELNVPVTFTHVPRCQNSAADSLVNHALDAVQ